MTNFKGTVYCWPHRILSGTIDFKTIPWKPILISNHAFYNDKSDLKLQHNGSNSENSNENEDNSIQKSDHQGN
jgi:hypothetical protein